MIDPVGAFTFRVKDPLKRCLIKPTEEQTAACRSRIPEILSGTFDTIMATINCTGATNTSTTIMATAGQNNDGAKDDDNGNISLSSNAIFFLLPLALAFM